MNDSNVRLRVKHGNSSPGISTNYVCKCLKPTHCMLISSEVVRYKFGPQISALRNLNGSDNLCIVKKKLLCHIHCCDLGLHQQLDRLRIIGDFSLIWIFTDELCRRILNFIYLFIIVEVLKR